MSDRESTRVLVVHNARTSFVMDDLEILSRGFTVTEWFVRSRFRLHFILLYRRLRASDLLFCWFASWHSLFPILIARAMNLPVVVVTGGYDTANVPGARYGSQRGGLRKHLTNIILRRADLLITNSHAACEEVCRIRGIVRKKVHVIYHGVHPFPFTPPELKERIALTVGGVWRENLLRKGLLPFVLAAKFLPDWRFVLVGKWHDDSIETLKAEAAENVEFLGFVDEEQLASNFARASVYVQASLHEGFGLSVAEAMTAGCWPVVSTAGSLPEVVGKYGSLMEVDDPRVLAHAIQEAHGRSEAQRRDARQWILDQFPSERRVHAIVNIVEEATAQPDDSILRNITM